MRSATAILLLLAAFTTGAMVEAEAAERVRSARETTSSSPSPAAGMRIHRDPATGAFVDRAPPSARKSLDDAAPVAGPDYDALESRTLDGGAVLVMPRGDQFHSTVRARAGVDGTIRHDCAQGPAHAHGDERPE